MSLDLQLKITANTQAALAQLQAFASKVSSAFNGARSGNPTQALEQGLNASTAAANKLNAALANTGKALNAQSRNKPLGDLPGQADRAGKAVSAVTAGVLALRAAYAFAAAEGAKFLTNATNQAQENSNAMTFLQLQAKAAGVSITEALEAAKRLSADGRITLRTASEGVGNLLSAGVTDIGTIEKFLATAKDYGSVARQAGLTLDEAISRGTAGIRARNSATSDSFGVQTNLAVLEENYAKSINTTSDKLTKKEAALASVNGMQKEMSQALGDGTLKTTEYAKAVSELTSSWNTFNDTLGRNSQGAVGGVMKAIGVILDGWGSALTMVHNFSRAVGDLFRDNRSPIQALPAKQRQDRVDTLPPQIQLDANGKPVGPLPDIPAASKPTPPDPLEARRTLAARTAEQIDAAHKIGEAQRATELQEAQTTAARLKAQTQDDLAHRKTTVVAAAKADAAAERDVKIQELRNLNVELVDVQAKIDANKNTVEGGSFDQKRANELTAQLEQTKSKIAATEGELKTMQITSATEVFNAQKELNEQASQIEQSRIQGIIDKRQTAFQAEQEFEQAELERQLAAHETSERESIEKTKQMRLAAIDEEVAQNKLRLDALASQRAAAGNDPVRLAQIAAEQKKLNAEIAASTVKRATTETNALTQVLQLEEKIKAARSSLVQQQAELEGKPLEAQLEAIKESVRQFNEQFSGNTPKEIALRAQRAQVEMLEIAKANFDEQKRLIDQRVALEEAAIERITIAHENGQISQREAELQTMEVRKQGLVEIEKNVIALEKMAAAAKGNKELQLAAEQARNAFERLRTQALDPLATSINKAFADSVTQHLENWINKTEQFRDLWRNVLADLFGNIAKRYLDKFSEDLFNALEGKGKNGSGNQGIGGAISSAISGALSGPGLSGVLNGLIAQLTKLFSSLMSGFSSLFSSFGGGASSSGLGSFISGLTSLFGFATGGPVYGAGTGTSDSILAKLSNGEFVVTAAAHKKFGTGFFQALNAGIFPSFSMPAFATGGPAKDVFTGGGAPNVNVTNKNQANLFLDPADLANQLGRQPQFGRDVIKVVLENKSKLGLRG